MLYFPVHPARLLLTSAQRLTMISIRLKSIAQWIVQENLNSPFWNLRVSLESVVKSLIPGHLLHLMNSLRSGYLTAVGESEDGFILLIDDSYKEDSIRLNVYTSMDFIPNRVEMFQNGICFLTMQISSFQLQ